MEKRSSKKQQELLQFIDNFIKGNGYGPSYREVMRGLGYKSVSTVAVHIDGLIAKGYLRKKDHSARSIEVVTIRSSPSPENVQKKDVAHLTWLEEEIERRIQKGDDATSVQTLIEAATILGSTKSAELQKKVSGTDDEL